MRSYLGTRKIIGTVAYGLAGVALTLGVGLSQPAKAAMTVQSLYEAIYVAQTCNGHTFSQEEWDGLVEKVRGVSASGYEGEHSLDTMVKAKSAAKRLTLTNQCSALQDHLDLYAKLTG